MGFLLFIICDQTSHSIIRTCSDKFVESQHFTPTVSVLILSPIKSSLCKGWKWRAERETQSQVSTLRLSKRLRAAVKHLEVPVFSILFPVKRNWFLLGFTTSLTMLHVRRHSRLASCFCPEAKKEKQLREVSSDYSAAVLFIYLFFFALCKMYLYSSVSHSHSGCGLYLWQHDCSCCTSCPERIFQFSGCRWSCREKYLVCFNSAVWLHVGVIFKTLRSFNSKAKVWEQKKTTLEDWNKSVLHYIQQNIKWYLNLGMDLCVYQYL